MQRVADACAGAEQGIRAQAQARLTGAIVGAWRSRPRRTWAPSSCRSPTSTARSTTGSASSGCACSTASNGRASLGTDTELVRFVEEPGARPADGHTGLYHVALLVPDRPSLARWLAHAARDRVALEGLSDHAVSEAIYLRDPDRHGIEIYADRPRELWEGHGRRADDDAAARRREPARRARRSCDRAVRRAARRDDDGARAPARRGRGVDRRVLPRRARHGADGAARRRWRRSSSAGGYHHHIGGNTWESARRARRPAPVPRRSGWPRSSSRTRPSSTASRHGSRMPARSRSPATDGVLVRDPSGNALLLT